ncbi:MAG: 2-octaprenyl-6-methoxyphenyl hydroxylase [Alphaproteobacteria bacterium]|nr:2-octaprenyl-6-methoxyphenyl hydroxylase [Alphaproteobacteria bacterium]
MQVDLAIVGGGFIGQALALAAASVGLRSALIERRPRTALADAGDDGRVSSLALGSQRMLAVLGVWPTLAAEAEPIRDIRVADGRSPLFLHFDHREIGDEPFGYMVENRFLRQALLAAVERGGAIRLLAGRRLRAIQREEFAARVELDDGTAVEAPLLVAADGRGSALRAQAGINALSWRYRQTAIVVTLAHERTHDGVAKEQFFPTGPFALLPMRRSRSSLVWSLRHDLARALLAADEATFLAAVERQADGQLGLLSLAGPRYNYPLALEQAERVVDRRLVLVGDAAQAMHPIAGQGLNLGLRDVACLAEVLARQARLGLDLGEALALASYQRWRRPDALAMLLMTDGLTRLFSNNLPPLRVARRLGLGLVNRLPAVKRVFERHAAAAAGDLPRLIRGLPVPP